MRWVLEVRPTLPRDLWREIRTLSFAFKTWQLGLFSAGPEGGLLDFEGELDRLRQMPLPVFVAEAARAFTPKESGWSFTAAEVQGDPAAQAVLLAEAGRRGAAYVQPARQLIAEPGALRERILSMLRGFWDACFAAEWQQLAPALAEDVAVKREWLREGDVYRFFRRILPNARVNRAERSILFRHHHEATVDLDQHPALLLLPSCFTWGRSRVECDPPWTPQLKFPAGNREALLNHLPSQLLSQVLLALGHQTRLQILRLCTEAPRSTQELARLLQMTEGGVSRHLGQLHAAGLVQPHRHSYYVLYRSVPSRIRAISPALLKYAGFR